MVAKEEHQTNNHWHARNRLTIICFQGIDNQTSIRDTTPFVTEMVSPPRGYPTTVTASCPFKMQQKNDFLIKKYIALYERI
jgi:uncharacterized phage-like protein YoqJ